MRTQSILKKPDHFMEQLAKRDPLIMSMTLNVDEIDHSNQNVNMEGHVFSSSVKRAKYSSEQI